MYSYSDIGVTSVLSQTFNVKILLQPGKINMCLLCKIFPCFFVLWKIENNALTENHFIKATLNDFLSEN